jgi:hypothetical protein
MVPLKLTPYCNPNELASGLLSCEYEVKDKEERRAMLQNNFFITIKFKVE